jgi:hypothetical protein
MTPTLGMEDFRAIRDFYSAPKTSIPQRDVQKPLPIDSYTENEKYPLDELCWGDSKPERIIQSRSLNCPVKTCPESRKDRTVTQYKEEGILKGITKSGPLGDHKFDKPYAAVCQCSSCNNKFWFHLDKERALMFQNE